MIFAHKTNEELIKYDALLKIKVPLTLKLY